MKRSRLLPAVLLYAWVPAQTTKAVLPGWRDVDPRVTSGRVVRDGDRAAIKGAKVETKGFRIDGRVVEADENGAFEVAGGPRCLQSGATSNWGIDYLRVSAPGCGVALVDTCASAPWADPIRLRPGATLTGKFEGVGEGHWINVVAPTKDTQVFPGLAKALRALKNGQIDGLVVDLPTADYITNVQIENGAAVIAGQFQGGTPEYFSAVLAKGSPLTECVNKAIDGLTQDGTLKSLASTWLPFQDKVPVFQP
jgi:hypothetical protein